MPAVSSYGNDAVTTVSGAWQFLAIKSPMGPTRIKLARRVGLTWLRIKFTSFQGCQSSVEFLPLIFPPPRPGARRWKRARGRANRNYSPRHFCHIVLATRDGRLIRPSTSSQR
ncbi:Uncharacterized protein DBV15_02571 [Temnothorax longispinosus]|uniref:Uncharacterized protein n=1 Tax=Temnothorax longispinosus TaxID=300112 RepID=A0A4S2KDG9_9HYME|nr:Uncharacterized protein DBV15_02571 [Temnothorax longispinosus]